MPSTVIKALITVDRVCVKMAPFWHICPNGTAHACIWNPQALQIKFCWRFCSIVLLQNTLFCHQWSSWFSCEIKRESLLLSGISLYSGPVVKYARMLRLAWLFMTIIQTCGMGCFLSICAHGRNKRCSCLCVYLSSVVEEGLVIGLVSLHEDALGVHALHVSALDHLVEESGSFPLVFMCRHSCVGRSTCKWILDASCQLEAMITWLATVTYLAWCLSWWMVRVCLPSLGSSAVEQSTTANEIVGLYRCMRTMIGISKSSNMCAVTDNGGQTIWDTWVIVGKRGKIDLHGQAAGSGLPVMWNTNMREQACTHREDHELKTFAKADVEFRLSWRSNWMRIGFRDSCWSKGKLFIPGEAEGERRNQQRAWSHQQRTRQTQR